MELMEASVRLNPHLLSTMAPTLENGFLNYIVADKTPDFIVNFIKSGL